MNSFLSNIFKSGLPRFARNNKWQQGFIKLTKKTLIMMLAALVILTSSGLLYLFKFTPKAEAAWFNDNWAYRQAITATVTSNSSDITNLETLITVNTSALISSKLQSSCQDLRFTNTNGKLLPYYIDSGCNTTTTKIWVMADLVPKNTTTYTLYMYYGNPSASAGSSSTMFDNVVGLKGYWTMNDNTGSTATDSSIGADNGTWNGTLGSQWTTGQYGSAGNFNGTDNYVNVPTPSSINTLTTLTISLWVNPSVAFGSQSSYARLIELSNSISCCPGVGGWDIEYAGGSGNNGLNFVTWTNGQVAHVTTITPPPTANVWTNYTWTITATADAIYANGVLITNYTATAMNTSSSNSLKIAVGSGAYFNGKIDDVHIYNTARTAAQITNDYNNTSCGGQSCTIATTAVGTITPSTSFATEETTPSALAYWKFDEGYGTTTSDSTTNSATGTLAGTTIPTWQTPDQCISGNCLFFNGSTSKVTVSKVVNNVQTVSMWVRPNSVSSSALIDLDGGTHKITVSSGTISATGFTSPTIYVNGIVASTLTANQWNFVEVTTGTGFATTSSLTIGNSSTTYFQGFMDEVKLYGYARSSAQVQADYNAKGNIEGLAENQGNSKNLTSALNNGLVGYWKMDESSGNLTDSSGNSNTGTVTGTTVVAGKYGNGRSFNGTTDLASVSDNSTVNFTSSLTLAFWINPSAWNNSSAAGIISKKANDTSNGYVVYDDSSSSCGGPCAPLLNFRMLGTTGGASFLYSTSSVTVGSWQHWVITYDSVAQVVNIYKNGVLDKTWTSIAIGDMTNTQPLHIGHSQTWNGYYKGTMDEVREYNRALSPSDVYNLYNFAPGPVGYWKFDEGSGSTVNDFSGNANTGTWNGTLGSQWTTGKYGKAGNFNGSNNYVSANVPTTNQTNWTIGAWINPAALSVLDIAVSNGADDGTCASATTCNGYAFGVGNGAGLAGSKLQGLLPGVVWIDSGYTFASTNTWYYVVMESNSSGTISFYVNGVATSGTSTSAPKGAPNNFRISSQSTAGRYFNGSIDEVRIYNYARSQQQIIEDMNAGHPPPGSPVGTPIGYWKFNEGYGTTAYNSGSQTSALNGTLSGSTKPSWTDSGKFGKALSFGGSNAYVAMPSDVSALKITSDLTLSAWINLTNTSSQHDIICKYTGTASTSAYCLFTDSSGKLNMAVVNSSGPTIVTTTGNTALSTSTWYHVTGVFQNGSAVTLYINGIQDKQNTTSIPTTLQNPATILDIGGENAGSNLMNGTIDEPKIYNFALTSAQVLEDMNRGQAQVLGALGNSSSYQPQAANQEYCVPGDSTSCAAPVGRWDFEEGSGTTANDSSGNANTGTLTGSTDLPTWTTGKIGKAINFDGTDDKVTTSLAVTPSNYASVTFEGWVYPSSTQNAGGTYQAIMGGDNGSFDRGFGIDKSTGKYEIQVGTVTHTWEPVAYTANTWQHVAVVYTSSSITFYLNGISYSFGSGGNIDSDGAGFEMGNDTVCGSCYLTGKIDSVRVFGYARSAAQVAWDYNRGAPVGWWKFDECQGTVAHDSSLNANNGTITIGASGTQTAVGTCTDGSSAHAWANGKTGKFNYSLNFDGTDDYVSVADTASLQLATALTVATWFKTSDTGTDHGIIRKDTSSGTRYLYGIVLNNIAGTGKIYGQYYNGTNFQVASLTAENDGNWHHAVETISGTTLTLYIDGVSQGTTTITGTQGVPTGEMDIGAEPPWTGGGRSGFLNGSIDEVKTYNYALTSSQVKLLFNQGSGIRYGPATGAP